MPKILFFCKKMDWDSITFELCLKVQYMPKPNEKAKTDYELALDIYELTFESFKQKICSLFKINAKKIDKYEFSLSIDNKTEETFVENDSQFWKKLSEILDQSTGVYLQEPLTTNLLAKLYPIQSQGMNLVSQQCPFFEFDDSGMVGKIKSRNTKPQKRKKLRRLAKNPISGKKNEDASLTNQQITEFEVELDYKMERPLDPLYIKQIEVKCVFCKELSSNKQIVKKLGPMYGPYRNQNQKVFFHEMCALWTPGIF